MVMAEPHLLLNVGLLAILWIILWLAGRGIYATILRIASDQAWPLRRRNALAIVGATLGHGLLLLAVLDWQDGSPHQPLIHRLIGVLEPAVGHMAVWARIIIGCIQALAIGIIPVLALGLTVRLCSISPKEATSADSPWKPWLSPANLVCAAALTLCAGIGLGLQFMGIAAGLAIVSLLGYPLIATLLAPPTPNTGAGEPAGADLTSERQRVLHLLEEGKVNARECSELLGAMAQTMPTARAIEPMTAPRRALILGAVVVLVGFFLPWFTINLGQEVQRAMRTMLPPAMDARQFGLGAGAAMPSFNQTAGPSDAVTVTGGDVQHGLGWLMLALAAAVAAMPYVVPTLPLATRRSAMFLSLAAGTVIGLYLLANGWRWAEYGLWIALCGSVVQWMGAIRDSRTASPAWR
jgi:hypothetical protein